ncbi:MAG: hypothetical protein ABSF90_03595 [Syntrophobacteraceae bacterium]|jgi:nucleotidyltransferase/DNA polymerase involved in DNA repair
MAKSPTVGQKTDKDWEAEVDAHTLARAKEITGDEKRLAAAVKAAKDIEKEISEDLKRIQSVGGLADKMYPKMEEKKEK